MTIPSSTAIIVILMVIDLDLGLVKAKRPKQTAMTKKPEKSKGYKGC